MPGPAPKSERLRRNRESPWTVLPASGREGRAPALPVRGHGLDAEGKRRWARLWASPEATQWHGYDAFVVLRLCQVEQAWRETGKVTLLGEVRHIESSLGLGPKGRREMRWRVDDGGGEAAGRGRYSSDRVRRLRVVDEQANGSR